MKKSFSRLLPLCYLSLSLILLCTAAFATPPQKDFRQDPSYCGNAMVVGGRNVNTPLEEQIAAQTADQTKSDLITGIVVDTEPQDSTPTDNSHTINSEPYQLTDLPQASTTWPRHKDPTAIPSRPPETHHFIFSYGDEIEVRNGTVYYASAEHGGSGSHGLANNPYTAHLQVAGFALIDTETGRIIASQCYQREHVPVGQTAPDFLLKSDANTTAIMIAAYTHGFTTGDVGWFHFEDVAPYKHDRNDGSGAKDATTDPAQAPTTDTRNKQTSKVEIPPPDPLTPSHRPSDPNYRDDTDHQPTMPPSYLNDVDPAPSISNHRS